jgi:hypothetical protein
MAERSVRFLHGLKQYVFISHKEWPAVARLTGFQCTEAMDSECCFVGAREEGQVRLEL